METSAIIRWMECHPGTSSYVQAAGVVLTLAGALFGAPIRATYLRWRHRRMLMESSDQWAATRIHDIHMMRDRIRRSLKNARQESSLNEKAERYSACVIEIPGRVDASLMRDFSSLDVSRLDYLFGFVEDVRAFNNALYADSIAAAVYSPQRGVQTIGRLESLLKRADEVLQTLRQRQDYTSAN